jgi:putative ABC transport system permease protein
VIDSTLTKNHGGQTDFNVLLPSQLVHSKTSILTLLTDLTIVTAIIALFVSGVGIMNVMLVSVTERMHEIGIRKAIGATNQQIMNQFLVESLTVSVVGGIFGILFGMLIIFIINISTSLSAIIDWQIILIAFGLSLLIGIVFGSIPALKASFMQPIDALRSE